VRAIRPRLTPGAQTALVRAYKRLRAEDATPGAASAYRITVRQLEALIRLSEAMARVYASKTIEAGHVREVGLAGFLGQMGNCGFHTWATQGCLISSGMHVHVMHLCAVDADLTNSHVYVSACSCQWNM